MIAKLLFFSALALSSVGLCDELNYDKQIIDYYMYVQYLENSMKLCYEIISTTKDPLEIEYQWGRFDAFEECKLHGIDFVVSRSDM